MTIEVLQDNLPLQNILDQYGYLEAGGYLAPPPIFQMIFQYVKQIDNASSSSEVKTKSETEDNSLFLDGMTIEDTGSISMAVEDGGMEGLMKDLFQALHNEI